MKDIPSDILEQFRNMLKKRLIPVGLHSYYLKWLRYYLDYCSKYYLPETSSRRLQQFLQKSLEKKQTEQNRKRGKEPAGFLNKGMYISFLQVSLFQKSRIVTLMVRQAHHDNVILSLSKDVEG